ncbi:uncharacterized protein LOC142628832 [Castanea sativa]|uniref:uncharacterized protein LOC142628832 n=1 Tax=Castanea sativa TaxID=21020 RepID=UPI003F64DF17
MHIDKEVRDDYKVEIFSIIAWLLWNRRNSIRLECLTWPLNHFFSEAGKILQDFLKAHDEAPITVQDLVQANWTALNQTRYKANFDGALFKNSDSVGLGVIIRDFNDAIISALSMSIPLPQSMEIVEALACRRAVQFAIKIGLHKVSFEGDATVVINAITNGMTNQSSYGHIIGDILAQASLLSSFDFCFVNQSCNRVVDALAKHAKVGLDLQVWLEESPKDIVPLVLDDVS